MTKLEDLTVNVEIGAEAALFPEKEYINGILVAVCAFLNRTHDIMVLFLKCSLY